MNRLRSVIVSVVQSLPAGRHCGGLNIFVVFTMCGCLIAAAVGTGIAGRSEHSRIPTNHPTTNQTKAESALDVVRVGSWTQPQSGWLYVLDPNNGEESAEILLVDPLQRRTVGWIKTGYEPDFALSPDGKFLYVASGHDFLTTIDTRSGAVVRTRRITDRVTYTGLPSVPTMAISPNGRWLFISSMKVWGKGSEQTSYRVRILDLLEDSILPDALPLEGCGIGRLDAGFNELRVQCFDSNDLRVFRLSSNGEVVLHTNLPLPRAKSKLANLARVSTHAILTAQASGKAGLVVIMGDGSSKLTVADHIGANSNALDDRVVPFRAWPVSPDETKLYVGSARASRYVTTGAADEVDVFGSANGRLLTTATTNTDFWNLALSREGDLLYAVSPHHRSIAVLDGVDLHRVSTVDSVGTTPVIAIVAP